MSALKGIIPAVLAVVLLLFSASCTQLSVAADHDRLEPSPSPAATPLPTPAPSLFTTPSPTASIARPTPHNSNYDPSLSVENDMDPDWGDWGDDSYEDWGLLPPPEISEADMQTFNPDRIVDYLAACPYVYHEYTITGAKLSEGQLLITVSDYIYSDWATDVFEYLQDTFSLSEEELFNLPLFSGFYMDYGWVTSDEGDVLSIGTIRYEDLLVASDAWIQLLDADTYEFYEVTVQEFADILLGGESARDDLGVFFFYFEYTDGQITGMYQFEEYEDWEYEEEGD